MFNRQCGIDQWKYLAGMRVVGTVPHTRKYQSEHFADQEKAADTTIVELYAEGMGLRVERRDAGYSFTGGNRGHLKIEGEGDDRSLVKEGEGAGAKRGKCKGATSTVMARFRDKLYKVRKDKVPVMITLTWPEANRPSPEEVKRCLNLFGIDLHNEYPKSCGFWKLEFGDDGDNPHLHLLVWGAHPWKGWIAKTWYRICRTNNPKHLTAGTRVEALRSYRGTLSYCGKKYLAKAQPMPPGDWGRVWGMFNVKRIPFDVPMAVKAPGRVGMWFARIMRRHYKATTGCKTGGRGRVLWVTTERVPQWLRVLEWAETLPIPGASRLTECPF